jgi:hypothetical protein
MPTSGRIPIAVSTGDNSTRPEWHPGKAIEIALDLDQLIHDVNTFLNAASIIERIGKGRLLTARYTLGSGCGCPSYSVTPKSTVMEMRAIMGLPRA